MSSTYYTSRPQSQNFFQKTPQTSNATYDKDHLTKVYSTLAVSLLSCSVGVYADIAFNVHGILMFIGTMVGVAMVFASSQQMNKLPWLLFTAFCMGGNIGPLVNLTLQQNPNLVFSALACSSAMFICLSAAAFVAPSKQYLYLGGMLSSAISLLMLVGLFNLFFRSPVLHSFSLYVGLLVYCGYVLFDTQKILFKVELGDRNYVEHALHLLTDFVGMFIRILIILNKNNNRNNNNNRNRR